MGDAALLSDEELLRYSRHLMLPEVDIAGQLAIKQARVLVLGAGGLGSAALLYLAAAGVGHLLVADDDRVELSNLQRQIAHGNADVGRLKCESAAAAAHRLNDSIAVTPLAERLSGQQLRDVVAGVDLVLDCTDNFPTRRALNQSCIEAHRPLVSGAAIGWEGQLLVIDPARAHSPCYACLYPSLPERAATCAESGVMAPVVGIIGSLQALAALKVLLNRHDDDVGVLHVFDGLQMRWQQLRVPKDSQCPVCAQRNLSQFHVGR